MNKARAFTSEERRQLIEEQSRGCVAPDDPARWDATLRAIEAQRDAAMVFASYWIDGGDHKAEAAKIRRRLKCREYSQKHSSMMVGIAAALEALPEEVPDIADAIDAVYANMATEEIEG